MSLVRADRGISTSSAAAETDDRPESADRPARTRIFKNSGVYGLDRFQRARFEALRQRALSENRKVRRGQDEFDVQVLPKPRADVRYKLESFAELNEKIRTALRTLSREMEASHNDKRERPPLILRMSA